jgi:hypothetical protein
VRRLRRYAIARSGRCGASRLREPGSAPLQHHGFLSASARAVRLPRLPLRQQIRPSAGVSLLPGLCTLRLVHHAGLVNQLSTGLLFVPESSDVFGSGRLYGTVSLPGTL